MKNENYNLNISTLDDKILYQEVCKKIKETDAISFFLIGLVPLVSGIVVLLLWAFSMYFSSLVLAMSGIFGALITYCISRWGKRNIQTGNVFKKYAEILEIRKNQVEQAEHESLEEGEGIIDGPYFLLNGMGKTGLFGSKSSVKWGKAEAEQAIYAITMIFWLSLGLGFFV